MIKLLKLIALGLFVLLQGCTEESNNIVNESQNSATIQSHSKEQILSAQTQVLEKVRAVDQVIQTRFDEQQVLIDEPND